MSNPSIGAVQAQAILLASLSITLLVAFLAVLWKQWILYYTRASTWGNIADRGKERQVKLVGLQRWGLHLVMDMLPVMLQLSLLLLAIAVVVYFLDLNISVGSVVLGITSFGLLFYVCIVVFATMYSDCPFQTTFSILLRGKAQQVKWIIAHAGFWLSKKAIPLRRGIEPARRHSFLKIPAEWISWTLTGGANTTHHNGEDAPNDSHMTISNPAFWRNDPLFTYTTKEDIAASAGFWLLENSTSSSAASAVVTVFSELQWPSHHNFTTALIRLRDVYVECVRAPKFKESTRLKALQSAAAYYVFYHAQLIRNASNRLEGEVEKIPPYLPPDLLLHLHSDKWGGDDTFECLLHTKDRSEPLMSGRFLAYLAPYWFCGDSDAGIRFRPGRLHALYELIKVLEESQALNPITLTDCILSVGAVMDLPLHPEDLIQIDKRCVLHTYPSTLGLTGDSDYLVQTFETVVEHVHSQAMTRGRRRRHTGATMEILVTFANKTTIPLVDDAWTAELLRRAVNGNMDDGTFIQFLRLNARRNEEGAAADHHIQGAITPAETATTGYALFVKILQNIQACSGQDRGWEDEVVYGGLIAMRDIPQLGAFPLDDNPLGALSNAMEKTMPFRVRKAAYDVTVVAREGWLRLASRQIFEDLNFLRKLHDIAHETSRLDDQRSFLMMVEILSEDVDWHSYLRGSMNIWLSFRREGPDEIFRILTRIGGLPPPEYDGSPVDEFLEKLVEDEWAAVPGRPVEDLAADRLVSLAEVTTQLKELLFTESGRKATLTMVERVIPLLERRREDGYEGPGKEIHDIINPLLDILRGPVPPTNRRYSSR